jgi:hypothetical protein
MYQTIRRSNNEPRGWSPPPKIRDAEPYSVPVIGAEYVTFRPTFSLRPLFPGGDGLPVPVHGGPTRRRMRELRDRAVERGPHQLDALADLRRVEDRPPRAAVFNRRQQFAQSITAKSTSDVLDRSPPLCRAQKLSCARLRQPDAASRRIALSSAASARSRFSRAFSFSRSFSRFAWASGGGSPKRRVRSRECALERAAELLLEVARSLQCAIPGRSRCGGAGQVRT